MESEEEDIKDGRGNIVRRRKNQGGFVDFFSHKYYDIEVYSLQYIPFYCYLLKK